MYDCLGAIIDGTNRHKVAKKDSFLKKQQRKPARCAVDIHPFSLVSMQGTPNPIAPGCDILSR
jgi:hypothetical protein